MFRLDPYSDITPNQLFCKVVRRNILLAYPRLSAKNVHVLLSNLWSKTLNGDERRTFARIIAEAKEREMDRLGREKRNRRKETAAVLRLTRRTRTRRTDPTTTTITRAPTD